ncbi:MAG TPA: hypothetical protein VL624_02785 [Caldimonas sp.]|jgi:hypothetical protein|nr:hypothetical protein [Caldimonas sp.]
MSEQASESERAAWHKRFASECNNRAWELTTATRSAADDREMLDVAHASAWHWGKVGGELNRMRATMLLAEVHALLGMGERALAHADEMRAYFLAQQSPDWEIAFAHAIYAHAAHVAGRASEHRDAYAEAEAALAAIADDEDRAIVAATFRLVPPPA